MKQKLLAMMWAAALVGPVGVRGAIVVGPFGPHGEGGSKNGQTFLIGPGGSVYELDGFVSITGQDLNGNLLGTTAQLSRDSLPTNLVYQFSWALSPDAADLVLTYRFSNTGSNGFNDVSFFALLDVEIDETINTFFNEYGTVQGSPGPGGGDPAPNQWQIDEPGFENGTLFRNLFLGSLDNSNSVPPSALNDVAMALGFSLGTLGGGESTSVRVMISEAGHLLGNFSLSQHDADPASTTVVTLSGLLGPGVNAQLLGTVFKDSNTNGVADPGEGLSGVTVVLASNAVTVAQTTTGPQGQYTLNAAPGTYTVAVVGGSLPGGLLLVPVVDGATNSPWPVSLVSDFPQTVNWGYRAAPVGAVSGIVFRDSNTNGLPDAGEALGGVVLQLQSNGVTVAQSTTDSNGRYSFTNTPGNYSLRLNTNTLPAGLVAVSVPSGASSNPANVTLPVNGVSVLNWGFAPPPVGVVSGIVFLDVNTNGLPDAGEALGGVVLQLQTNGVTVAQSTTDSSGRYGFTNTPGNFSLRLNTNTLPAGLVAVSVPSGASSNPANVTLPVNGVSVLNWGFQHPGGVQFEELSGLVQFGLSWSLNRARGTLVGSLSLTNLPGSGAALAMPWQLGMKNSSQFFYPTNFGVGVGVLPDGVPCVDLSGAMRAQYGSGPVGAGQRLTLTNAVEIYSLTRSAPLDSQFELWATRQ